MYADAINAYKNLKRKTNIVFGLTHLSLSQDKLLARSVPETPLIMGGHEHHNLTEKIGNVTITKADANAKTAYVHRIAYNIQTKKTTINSELVKITPALGSDPKVKERVALWNNLLEEKIKNIIENPSAVIYHAKEPLNGLDIPTRSVQTNLGQNNSCSNGLWFR